MGRNRRRRPAARRSQRGRRPHRWPSVATRAVPRPPPLVLASDERLREAFPLARVRQGIAHTQPGKQITGLSAGQAVSVSARTAAADFRVPCDHGGCGSATSLRGPTWSLRYDGLDNCRYNLCRWPMSARTATVSRSTPRVMESRRHSPLHVHRLPVPTLPDKAALKLSGGEAVRRHAQAAATAATRLPPWRTGARRRRSSGRATISRARRPERHRAGLSHACGRDVPHASDSGATSHSPAVSDVALS